MSSYVPDGDASVGAGALYLREVYTYLLGLLRSGMRDLRLLVASRLFPLLVLTAALLGCLSRSVLGLLGGSGCRVLCLACCLSGGIACTLSSLARFFDCLPGPLSSLLSGLPHFVDGLSCATTDIFHC